MLKLQAASAAAVPPGRPAARPKGPTARFLHVLNGDTAAETFRATGVPGSVAISADVLYDGPVPRLPSAERWRRVRARFLAECGFDGYEECLARLTRWDREIESYRSYDEVVLWFEHDLFDQLQLIRLLAWFAEREPGLTELSLIRTSSYLGRLEPASMAALLFAREPVEPVHLRLGLEAWRAFCAPEPHALEALLARDTTALPFLSGALHRHLEEYPAVENGLPRTEREALAALAGAAPAPLPLPTLFRAVQAAEERIYMTDTSFLWRLKQLASGHRPLVRLAAGAFPSPRAQTASITATGLAVLAGREDWVEIRGIDRWLGGVQLAGRWSAWRWDSRLRKLVSGY